MALSKKHQAFVNNFFIFGMNGTDAYQATYPKASRETARANAADLLANTDIKAEVQARMEVMKMSGDEAIVRLSDIARGSMEDFLIFQEGMRLPILDFKKAKELGRLHLIKKLEYTKEGGIKFELYPADAAQRDIARVNGLFKDVQELTGSIGAYSMTKEEWQKAQQDRRKQAQEALADFEDESDPDE